MSENYRAGGTEGRPRGRDEWSTPPSLYRALDREFSFRLDAACNSENMLAPSGICADLRQDARLLSWSPGPVWLNPPYSGQSGVRPWLERADLFRQEIVVCLVPSDTSTRWWYEVVAQRASEVRFVVGRLRFLPPDGKPHYTKRSGGGLTVPSAIVIFGPKPGPPDYRYILRDGSAA